MLTSSSPARVFKTPLVAPCTARGRVSRASRRSASVFPSRVPLSIARARPSVVVASMAPRRAPTRKASVTRSRARSASATRARVSDDAASRYGLAEAERGATLRWLPTFLTILRVIAVPVLAWVYYSGFEGAAPITGVIFIVAAITDWLDGYLARRLKASSAFGAFLIRWRIS